MSRINKTKNNLQQIWDDLDLACGSLDNAFSNIERMVGIEDIVNDMKFIDISAIVSLKNRIEGLMESNQTEG